MNIFEKKTKKDYNKDVLKVFDKLTINGKYTVIGSGNLKKIEYNSDYDLQELIKEKKGKTVLDKIYHLFKDKFKSCKKDDNYFITDFKCGLNTDGEPLRWDYNDMMKMAETSRSKNGNTFTYTLIDKKEIIKKRLNLAVVGGILIGLTGYFYYLKKKKIV